MNHDIDPFEYARIDTHQIAIYDLSINLSAILNITDVKAYSLMCNYEEWCVVVLFWRTESLRRKRINVGI